jgi:acyl-CoA dehydrogenase
MDFSLSQEQETIREAIAKICERFDDQYWLEKDKHGGFPADFHQALAKDGWLGICIPEVYGGSGLGITEAAIMMQTISESGAGMSGASAVHMNIFGLNPVVQFGTEEQKKRMLPPLVAGTERACFAVTEPNTGLNTTQLKVKAERAGDHYVLSGTKVWISTAQVAEKMLILARTTPLEEVKKHTDGLSLFYTDFDRNFIKVHEIEKMGRKAVDSNELFIDGLKVPVADRIGEEGKGFHYIMHGMNAERILIAAECIGDARWFVDTAAAYAKSRRVFGRPIGQNQGVQFPIAKAYAAMRSAELMVHEAIRRYEAGEPCGAEANMAKMLAADASWQAGEACLQTHGGFGFAEEYDVERKFRETRLYQVAPISTNLVLSYIAEHVLGLPRSF